MRRVLSYVFATIALAFCLSTVCHARTISMEEYLDRVRAAWIGKMAGVGWGITTEFRYSHRIVPDSLMYDWNPAMINEGYNQDDMYLSIFALKMLDKYGSHPSARKTCIDRQNIEFEYGRRSRHVLEDRIAPPDVSHPHYKPTADGCGYTCGADYSGIVAPGLPQAAYYYGNEFGSYVAYGDGIYGGIFLGSMYCEAFFEDNINRIIKKALKSIPEKSLVHQAVEDVVLWHSEYPEDWKKTWQNIMDRYWWNLDNNQTSWPYGGQLKGINLDSKSMCAFTVMALLYGKGDLMETIRIAVQGSEDSDCNASIAAGILCASKGMKAVDEVFYSSLRKDVRFKYMDIGFDGLMSLTESVARQVIPAFGGEIVVKKGVEVIRIKDSGFDMNDLSCVSTFSPGPLTGAHYEPEEMTEREFISDCGFENYSTAWSFFLDNRANHILPVRSDLRMENFLDGKARTGHADAKLDLWYKNGYRRSGTRMFAGLRQIVKLDPGKTYRLSCHVRTEGKGLKGKGRLRVCTLDGKVLSEVSFGEKPDWTKVGLKFESGCEMYIIVEAGMYGVNDRQIVCRFDDFSIKSYSL